jgi:hypothetical protein
VTASVDGRSFTFNREFLLDPCFCAVTGIAVTDTEDAAAVQDVRSCFLADPRWVQRASKA